MNTNYFTIFDNDFYNFRFNLENVSVALANSIRRAILSEVPTISFDDMPNKHFDFMNKKYDKSIDIINNQSPLHNEFLSHRISLIPLNLNNHKIESKFSPEVNQRIFTLSEQDSLPEFELRLQMEKNSSDEMVKITSDMFKIINNKDNFRVLENENENDTTETDNSSELYIKPDPQILKEFQEKHYILITKLNNDIDLDFHVKAKPMIGIGRYNSKYCPVGTVTYSFKRVDDFEIVKQMFIRVVNKVSGERLQKGLSGYDSEQLIWGASNLKDYDGDNKEDVLNLWKSFKHLDIDRIYERNERNKPKIFQYNIESIGSLDSRVILYSSLDILKYKIMDVKENLNNEMDFITINRSRSIMRAFDFIIKNETHTIGNLISDELQNNGQIEYASYKMPHPLEKEIVLRVKIKSETGNLKQRK